MLRVILALALVQISHTSLQLIIQDCPTAFSNGGALVSVDPTTGKFKIDGRFKWPSELFGCADLDEPSIYINGSTAYFEFLSTFGVIAELDLKTAKMKFNEKVHAEFFTGFQNFYQTGNKLLGIAGAVEQHGWCSDGCFAWGKIDELGGRYTKIQDIPYKAILDDTHLVLDDRFYVQGSYPLTPDAYCTQNETDQCLIAINVATGTVETKQKTPWEVYKWGHTMDSNGDITSWVNGFASKCQHPYNDFLFAKVNPKKATATPIACIGKNVTVHMDEWISIFSPDDKMFATASGNTEAPAQLLVFDTATGATVLNSDLKGLKEVLHTYSGLYQIWGVAWW